MKTIVICKYGTDEVLGEIPFVRKTINAIINGRDLILKGNAYRYISFQNDWISDEGFAICALWVTEVTKVAEAAEAINDS